MKSSGAGRRQRPNWTPDEIPDQTGRSAIITGATSGLGFETARELARKGAHVVLAARDAGRLRSATERIRAVRPDASVEARLLDLADLDSVKTFAEDIIRDDVPVEVLVNNAGVMWPPRRISAQGHELQFATNHLGHFALTGLLLGRLQSAAECGKDARVVTVSSLEHRGGRINFDDLTGERNYSPRAYYSQSKLANLLFGLELDRRLRASRSSVRSIVAHPGYAATELQTAGPTGARKFLFGVVLNKVLAQSATQGAWSQLYAATSPAASGGEYIGPDGAGQLKGHPRLVRPAKQALDLEVADRLWAASENLTDVTFSFAG